jgi:hypothetical protein
MEIALLRWRYAQCVPAVRRYLLQSGWRTFHETARPQLVLLRSFVRGIAIMNAALKRRLNFGAKLKNFAAPPEVASVVR